MTKYSKTFGEVEVISDNGTISKIRVVSTGEVKDVMNQYAKLQDEPFGAKRAKKAAVKKAPVALTAEEKLHLEYLNATGQGLVNVLAKSKANYRSGNAGMSSLTK